MFIRAPCGVDRCDIARDLIDAAEVFHKVWSPDGPLRAAVSEVLQRSIRESNTALDEFVYVITGPKKTAWYAGGDRCPSFPLDFDVAANRPCGFSVFEWIGQCVIGGRQCIRRMHWCDYYGRHGRADNGPSGTTLVQVISLFKGLFADAASFALLRYVVDQWPRAPLSSADVAVLVDMMEGLVGEVPAGGPCPPYVADALAFLAHTIASTSVKAGQFDALLSPMTVLAVKLLRISGTCPNKQIVRCAWWRVHYAAVCDIAEDRENAALIDSICAFCPTLAIVGFTFNRAMYYAARKGHDTWTNEGNMGTLMTRLLKAVITMAQTGPSEVSASLFPSVRAVSQGVELKLLQHATENWLVEDAGGPPDSRDYDDSESTPLTGDDVIPWREPSPTSAALGPHRGEPSSDDEPTALPWPDYHAQRLKSLDDLWLRSFPDPTPARVLEGCRIIIAFAAMFVPDCEVSAIAPLIVEAVIALVRAVATPPDVPAAVMRALTELFGSEESAAVILVRFPPPSLDIVSTVTLCVRPWRLLGLVADSTGPFCCQDPTDGAVAEVLAALVRAGLEDTTDFDDGWGRDLDTLLQWPSLVSLCPAELDALQCVNGSSLKTILAAMNEIPVEARTCDCSECSELIKRLVVLGHWLRCEAPWQCDAKPLPCEVTPHLRQIWGACPLVRFTHEEGRTVCRVPDCKHAIWHCSPVFRRRIYNDLPDDHKADVAAALALLPATMTEGLDVEAIQTFFTELCRHGIRVPARSALWGEFRSDWYDTEAMESDEESSEGGSIDGSMDADPFHIN